MDTVRSHATFVTTATVMGVASMGWGLAAAGVSRRQALSVTTAKTTAINVAKAFMVSVLPAGAVEEEGNDSFGTFPVESSLWHQQMRTDLVADRSENPVRDFLGIVLRIDQPLLLAASHNREHELKVP